MIPVYIKKNRFYEFKLEKYVQTDRRRRVRMCTPEFSRREHRKGRQSESNYHACWSSVRSNVEQCFGAITRLSCVSPSPYVMNCVRSCNRYQSMCRKVVHRSAVRIMCDRSRVWSMAIMQSCCCWRSVRRGSFACALYTGRQHIWKLNIRCSAGGKYFHLIRYYAVGWKSRNVNIWSYNNSMINVGLRDKRKRTQLV